MNADNTKIIDAIRTIAPQTRKRTSLWNRNNAEGAGILANEAYLIRPDIWLVVHADVLFLFVGDALMAKGRHDVLKNLVDYVL